MKRDLRMGLAMAGRERTATRGICYNTAMPEHYVIKAELDEEEEVLARCAREASRDAVRAAFAAGLSITIAKGDKIVQVAPDGTETVIGDL